MARPPKQGLDYFPKDTDFYNDFKIIDLLDTYGALGVLIYEVILCEIYKSGYYLEIPLNKLSLIISRTIGNKWIKGGQGFVLKVIDYCADIGLFDSALLQQNVLTSFGIQRRYDFATVRNKADKSKYWLLEESEPKVSTPKNRVSVTETLVNATETSINDVEMPQRKEKESKVNKSKGKGNIDPAPIIELFKEICVSFPKPVLYDELADSINACKDIDFKLLFEKAEKSNFLSGRTGKWKCDMGWILKNAGRILSGAFDNCEKPKSKYDRPSYDIDELSKIR